VYMCVYVCVKERERVCMFVRERVCVYVSVCVCLFVAIYLVEADKARVKKKIFLFILMSLALFHSATYGNLFLL